MANTGQDAEDVFEPVVRNARLASRRYGYTVQAFALMTLASVFSLIGMVLYGFSINSIFVFGVIVGLSGIVYGRMISAPPLFRCEECQQDMQLDAPWRCGWCGTRHLTNVYDSALSFRTAVQDCNGKRCAKTAAFLVCPNKECQTRNTVHPKLVERAERTNSGSATFL